MKTTIRLSFLFAGLAWLSSSGAVFAPASQATGTSTASSTASKKAAPKAAPSAEQIADAKSKAMVWANLSTHVYHKGDSSMYGTTKRGKFMTEEDAKRAGFRMANESGSQSKKKAAASGTAK